MRFPAPDVLVGLVSGLLASGLLAQGDAGGGAPSDAAAEAKAKGLVEVAGVWVEKAHVDDAKRGVFHHGDELVTKDEYAAFAAGRVRHPVTGQLIAAEDLPKAEKRQFPIGTEDRWVDEREADSYHNDTKRPWQLCTGAYTLVSTLPIADLEAMREHADRAMQQFRPVLGFAQPKPIDRPTVLVAATTEQFVEFGNRLGDESSAFAAFLAQEGRLMRVALQGDVLPAVCHWDQNWGAYNLPHAVGLAYVSGLCAASGTEVPGWFLHGVAAYGSRYPNPETAAWFAQSLVRAGGMKPLKGWFDGFKIDGSRSPEELGNQATEAGLLIDFCVRGGDKKATDALNAVSAAFPTMKAAAIAKAITGLRKVLEAENSAVETYLQKLAQ